MAPPYLSKPVQNPYELSENEASRLGYPRTVDLLTIHRPDICPGKGHLLLSRDGEILCEFFDKIVCNTEPVHIIMAGYKRSRVDSLMSDIIVYFHYLKVRLCTQAVGGDDGNYDCVVQYDRANYACYGSRFWNWLVESKRFNHATLVNYSVLLYVYLSKFPGPILKLHEKLRKANCGSKIRVPEGGHFDYKMVSFKLLDALPLHNSLMRMRTLTEQHNHFVSSVYPSNKPVKSFLIQELKKCLKYYEIDFVLQELGVLNSNGSALTDRHFEFGISFKDCVNPPDWSTLHLLIKAIRVHFCTNYAIDVNEYPLDDDELQICFDFKDHLVKQASKKKKNNNKSSTLFQCYLHLDTSYVNTWSLIRFLSKCDNRFMEMILVLHYWAQSIGLYEQEYFNCYALIFMVVFALQRTSPPVFKPLNQLVTTQECSGGQDLFREDKSWNRMAICNRQSTGELIVGFFEFFQQFEFENFIICPRTGKAIEKKLYFNCGGVGGGNQWSSICVESPLNNRVDQTVLCTAQKMSQFRNCLQTYLDDFNLNSNDYLTVLTNPDYFDLNSTIYSKRDMVFKRGSTTFSRGESTNMRISRLASGPTSCTAKPDPTVPIRPTKVGFQSLAARDEKKSNWLIDFD